MRKVIITTSLAAIILFNFYTININAQSKFYTSKQALSIFHKGNFIEAEQAYSQLLKKYPRDANYNFYMGICELNNKSNITDAIQKLNFARIKRVSHNVYYYLGKAQRANSQFEEAIKNFSFFLRHTSSRDKRYSEVKSLLNACKTAQNLSLKIYQLTVLDKKTLAKDSLLGSYHPSKDMGSIMLNKDFFKSKAKGTLFISERKDVMYYASEADSGQMNIFQKDKLLDGWGKRTSLKSPVNSKYNDAYPFMATDGVTLYFASDRPGGFGGFDIYKTYFDTETLSFAKPVNMGVPFNSSGDDFLFVPDEFNGVAWFASNRATNNDSVMVYTVKWDGTQVRNMAENNKQISNSAQLKLKNEITSINQNITTTSIKSNNNQTKSDFSFTINDSITYSIDEDFLSKEALLQFIEGQKKEKEKDLLSVLMKDKRKSYVKIKSPEEQNKLITQILKLENQVYSLDDTIEKCYVKARYLESIELKKQKTTHSVIKKSLKINSNNNNNNQSSISKINKTTHNINTHNDKKVSQDTITHKEKVLNSAVIIHKTQKDIKFNTIEYRVQIGIFHNSPNPTSLSKIPPISTSKIAGKNLTKYMSGHFKTYKEAKATIPKIVAAGFKGAYVVSFKDGIISKAIPKQ